MCKKFEHVIGITNRTICQGDYLEQLRSSIRKGPDAVILREKDLTAAEYLILAKEVQSICEKNQTPLFVHSYIEIARELGCRRIHMPFWQWKTMFEEACCKGNLKNWEISVSCHSLEEAIAAEQMGATQIVLGTIFETACKPGKQGAGLSFLEEVVNAVSIPVYGIGGIHFEELEQVLKTGARGGCMMSEFMRLYP